MPAFTIYLIKKNFVNEEKYYIDSGLVKERPLSIFNDGVTFVDNFYVSQYLANSEIDERRLQKSKSKYCIYYRESENENPWWKKYWQIPEPLKTKSADIIIVLEVKGRIFVVSHGHGRHLINPLSIVYDFGLKTALNIIDETKIKAADLFTPSSIGMRTKKQSGSLANIDEYDINIFNSLLKNVAGAVRDEYIEYFKNIDGADSIKFSFSESPEELIAMIELLFEQYELEEYKKHGFEWIDNFRQIKDKGQIDILDSLLLNELNKQNEDIILDYQEIKDGTIPIYYRYAGVARRYGDRNFPILDITTQYYPKILERGITLSIEDIKRQQVIAVNMNEGSDYSSRKIYQCLYYDIEHKGVHYFIESGNWYSVDKRFSTDLDTRILDIAKASRKIDLIYRSSEIATEAVRRKANNELIYNEQLVSELSRSQVAELLDSNILPYKKGKIELCDIMIKDPEKTVLMHNKYKNGSNTLSHLFSQGYVSSKLITENEFRKLANTRIKSKDLQFPEDGDFSREKYVILFGIIAKKNRKGVFVLPLFSKINFDMFSQNIALLGYKIELSFIESVT